MFVISRSSELLFTLNTPTAISKVREHSYILAELVKDSPVILFLGSELLNQVKRINPITWKLLPSWHLVLDCVKLHRLCARTGINAITVQGYSK